MGTEDGSAAKAGEQVSDNRQTMADSHPPTRRIRTYGLHIEHLKTRYHSFRRCAPIKRMKRRLNTHGHLPFVATFEQADQRLRRLVEAVDDIDNGLDLALFAPAREPRLGLGALVEEIHDDEAFQAQ